jgi:hypothetical protein
VEGQAGSFVILFGAMQNQQANVSLECHDVRYDDMVLEAVLGLKEPYGSSNASIANYIEVPCFYEQHALSAVLIH